MLKLTRWTIAHRPVVILSWFVITVGLFGLSQAVGTRTAENFSLPGTNSQHALDLLRSRFP
jgi:RND superfamily putative drug exporter